MLDIKLDAERFCTETHERTIARLAALTSVADQSGIALKFNVEKVMGTISTGAGGAALLEGFDVALDVITGGAISTGGLVGAVVDATSRAGLSVDTASDAGAVAQAAKISVETFIRKKVLGVIWLAPRLTTNWDRANPSPAQRSKFRLQHEARRRHRQDRPKMQHQSWQFCRLNWRQRF